MNKVQRNLSNGSQYLPKVTKLLRERMSRGAKLFCDDSTFHGFKQMYYSKYLSYKLMWLLVLMTACGVAFFQIVDVIRLNFNQPTTTIIKPYSDAIEYPPFKICHAHWLYWVDWEKAEMLGLDHDSLAFGMSKWYEVYSSLRFDTIDANYRFGNISSNFSSNVPEMYKYMSRDEPAGFTSVSSNFSYNRNFLRKLMCYEPITDWTHTNPDEPFTIDLIYNESFYKRNKFITDLEYAYYVIAFQNLKMDYADVNFELLPPISPMLFVDSLTDQVTINSNFFEYKIYLKASVFKWRNSVSSVCNPNETERSKDWLELCKSKCRSLRKTEESENPCLEFDDMAALGNESYPLCPFPVHIIEDQSSSVSIGHLSLKPEMFDNNNESLSLKKKNKKKSGPDGQLKHPECECIKPCVQWIYERTVVANQLPNHFLSRAKLPVTEIKIIYPLPAKILLSIEQVTATWQSISGNIGGILGLWLGASVISFLQLIYLCCCKECDVGLVSRSVRRQKGLRQKSLKEEKRNNQKY